MTPDLIARVRAGTTTERDALTLTRLLCGPADTQALVRGLVFILDHQETIRKRFAREVRETVAAALVADAIEDAIRSLDSATGEPAHAAA